MPTTIVKRSVIVDGHKTSISLEDEFFAALRSIAVADKTTIRALVSKIARDARGNVSSALRVFVLKRALEPNRNWA